MGDSWGIEIILDMPENRVKVEELGFISVENYKTPTLEEVWKEI